MSRITIETACPVCDAVCRSYRALAVHMAHAHPSLMMVEDIEPDSYSDEEVEQMAHGHELPYERGYRCVCGHIDNARGMGDHLRKHKRRIAEHFAEAKLLRAAGAEPEGGNDGA